MDAQILRILKSGSATIPEIAAQCHVPEEVIRTRLLKLEEVGFAFTVHPALGLNISRTPSQLVGDLILSGIPEGREPCAITVYQSTRSTNDLAHRAGQTQVPCPAVFLAEQQTAGRGRNGRVWESDSGLGLWMSILLVPTLPQIYWPRLTTAAATLVTLTLRSELKLPVQIKWPNDIWIGSSKLAGIIAETGNSSGGPYAVLGIGLNVLHTASDFPPHLQSKATSLNLHLSPPPSRNELAAKLLTALSQLDEAISTQGFPDILNQARNLSCVLNQSIDLTFNHEQISGFAMDLTAEGHLVLRTSEGVERVLHSGEVTHIRPSC